MKEIISTNINLDSHFTMKDMLEIYQAAKQYKGNTIIYCNQKSVDASNMPKLVSFLLTQKANTSIKVIVEGVQAKKHLAKIKETCANRVSAFKKADQPLMTETV
ncbi:HPr family phosphocarrier protein [Bacillus infantis]|jgi:phosphotransferase system HPr-like phosphotransfer protein|uniref:HPr family phosphocarrier protein n=1 Tax=Bacillus infantis TaxID=324767 RepID=UPI00215573DF|nr:HPr family phosphocarrier protein [Bacillus infantis]MCR6609868.1 HPr family phosphocarrier protein [Bacillus infantis]